MTDNGAKIITPRDVKMAIPSGYHNGYGYVEAIDITSLDEYNTCLELTEAILGGKCYTELEYIEGTGTQYIDTEYTYNNNCRLILTASKLNSDNILHGSTTWSSDGITVSYWSGSLYYSYDTNYLLLDSDLDSVHTLELYRTSAKVDNESVSELREQLNTRVTFTSILLFRRYDAGTNPNFYSKCRIHGFKIYDNNVLVRDFIPVQDYFSNACLYDKVSHRFFYNKGTGDFIKGGIK